MMPERLYSIIVPVYNAETTLNRCVDSILAQTYRNFELILVDDGSRDRSAEIIDQYASADPRVIAIHKLNGGVSSARNAGLDRAKGEYVTFADADDYVKSEWLETFVCVIKENDIAVQSLLSCGKSNEIISLREENNLNVQSLIMELVPKQILGYVFVKLFKKSIIDLHHIRFEESIRYREDDLFVLKYLEYATSCASTEKACYLYFPPKKKKNYGTTDLECTEPFFDSLNKIFNRNIPEEILTLYAYSVKNKVLDLILNKKVPTLSDKYTTLYHEAVVVRSSGIKAWILNNLIMYYNIAPSISYHIIKISSRLLR